MGFIFFYRIRTRLSFTSTASTLSLLKAMTDPRLTPPQYSTGLGTGYRVQLGSKGHFLIARTYSTARPIRFKRAKLAEDKMENELQKELEPPEEFPFPFQPYDIQKDFMRNLYTALERGCIGIFESPTGTVRQ